MARNPFINHKNATPKLKRNSYDMSFQNNLSLKVGYEYPILVKEALPGDSFRVKMGAFLRAFPTAYPVQTPIRMSFYLFQVYNRTLHDQWQDFIYENDSEVVPPYLDGRILKEEAKVGSLYDFMGVPVNYFSNSKVSATPLVDSFFVSNFNYTYDSALSDLNTGHVSIEGRIDTLTTPGRASFVSSSSFSRVVCVFPNASQFLKSYQLATISDIVFNYSATSSGRLPVGVCGCGLMQFVSIPSVSYEAYSLVWMDSDYQIINSQTGGSMTVSMSMRKCLDELASRGDSPVESSDPDQTILYFPVLCLVISSGSSSGADSPYITCSFNFDFSEGVSLSDSVVRNPFLGTEGGVRLSALPFRGYEGIHNAFFRDNLNDPWFIDGKPQYNNFITTHASGEDHTRYHLFQHNWEKDFLTSAYPSPQQGLAPLVGITQRGNMLFEREDGSVHEVESVLDENGELQSFKMDDELLANRDQLKAAMDLVTSGIAINDLRQVGAFQRWKEANIRRGYRYREQLLAHTGVHADYDELDMPIFVGGYSRIVNTSQINNQATGGDKPLGAFAGQLSFFNQMDRSLSCFFKEHGFLMGILVITPVPAYSQLLPKYFLKDTPLDYFSPEFAHLGMQPITYKEVCPLQAYNDPDHRYSLNDTFGYQRPWYDLIASVDEVHGQMRTSMRDFIMNRTFDGVPVLNGDFLHIDPRQVNQVFTVTDPSEDTFFGQVVFDIQKKCQVPRSGIPMLNA